MTTSHATPAPARPPATVRVTAWFALAGLVLAAIGIVVLLRPLSTPTQDCGTAAGFLLDGRVDQVADPDNPPTGTTRADVLDNNAERCQERAANRAKPALAAVVAGALIGLVAVVVEAIVRWRWRVASHRAWLAGTAPPGGDEAVGVASGVTGLVPAEPVPAEPAPTTPGDPSDPS